MSDSTPRRHGALMAKLLVLTLAMFGFGYLLVPLYDIFCEITGLGGRTNTEAVTPVVAGPDLDRTVTVEFLASVNASAPWEFRPTVSRMEVHPGTPYRTDYFAKNLRDASLVGHATPSVAPGQAAKYFLKTECFCFTEQRFEANEGRDMPVIFIVDPDLPEHIDTVSLSYTFFAREPVAAAN